MRGKRWFAFAVILVLVAASFPGGQAAAVTITVDWTNDEWDAGSCDSILPANLPGPDGHTSLREAMCAANNNPGADFIQFDLPGAGVQTIQPFIPLPVLTDDETVIDGYTQAGSAQATANNPAMLLVQIDCSLLTGHNCLEMTSAHNRISGLVINGAGLYGIAIGYPSATYNQISGNHIGTDPAGEAADPNGWGGVVITSAAAHNIIGGIEPADRNVISGNGWDGVSIYSPETDVASTVNMVLGNYLGLDALGQDAIPNGHNGVRIYGNSHDNTIGANVISGNVYYGVMLEGSSSAYNVVAANIIGLSADGSLARGNLHGIVINGGANHNTIGGSDPGAGNIIAGNANYGIMLNGEGTDSNLMIANLIGTGPNGQGDFGWQQVGVEISYGPDNNAILEGIIAHHSIVGIHVYNTTGYTTIRNVLFPSSIYDNSYGIDLEGENPNGNILPPTIETVDLNNGFLIIQGYAVPNSMIAVYISDVNEGQGKRLFASVLADSSGHFYVETTPVFGRYITATNTDYSLGTSEFSSAVELQIFGIFLPVLTR